MDYAVSIAGHCVWVSLLVDVLLCCRPLSHICKIYLDFNSVHLQPRSILNPMAPDPPTFHVLDRLLTELSQYATHPQDQPNPTPNPLARIPPAQQPKVKPLLLTLHCLFPNELLLALDILDRGLVRRIGDVTRTSSSSSTGDDLAERDMHREQYSNANDVPNADDVFFVTSASVLRPYPNKEKSYEVRLHAWNCTCPTFSLLEFRAPLAEPGPEPEPELSASEPGPSGQCYGGFGGTLTRAKSSAVCKHLLACVLLVRCPGIFGECRRVANREELAGCCSGWGG